jgi:hypothetical protein
MYRSSEHLEALGLPGGDAHALPETHKRFPDGARFRVEIPSVEGPAAMRVVIAEAARLGVHVHRVSQGSGIWMLTDEEIGEMVALGREHEIEVVLFVGPRAAWDVGRQVTASSGAVVGASLRGADALAAGTDDVLHACELGVRGVLVADLGHLMVLGRLKAAGVLPGDLQLKVSVSLPVANPATARVMEELGATSLNLPVDLPVAAIAAIREAVALPLDVYVEAADDFGGGMRHYEVARLVRCGAPIYLKYTVRNAPGTYPSGAHIQGLVEALSAERVRRAALGLNLLRRYMPEIVSRG